MPSETRRPPVGRPQRLDYVSAVQVRFHGNESAEHQQFLHGRNRGCVVVRRFPNSDQEVVHNGDQGFFIVGILLHCAFIILQSCQVGADVDVLLHGRGSGRYLSGRRRSFDTVIEGRGSVDDA